MEEVIKIRGSRISPLVVIAIMIITLGKNPNKGGRPPKLKIFINTVFLISFLFWKVINSNIDLLEGEYKNGKMALVTIIM